MSAEVCLTLEQAGALAASVAGALGYLVRALLKEKDGRVDDAKASEGEFRQRTAELEQALARLRDPGFARSVERAPSSKRDG